jgi:hypothetical protein
LQLGFAAAEQRQDWHHARQGSQAVEECVLRAEDNARAEDGGAGESFSDQVFADASGADICGVGRRIGAEARYMNKSPDSRHRRCPRDMHCALAMNRLEGRLAPLDIMADRVDHSIGAIHHRGHRCRIPDVGVNWDDLPSPAGLCKKCGALRTTHRDANVGTVVGQTLHDLATQESRTSEHGDTVVVHVRFPADVEANYVTVSEEAHPWKRLLEAGRYRSAGELAEAEDVARNFVNRLLR